MRPPTDRLFALVLALCCVGATGFCAATMEGSVSTRPADVVDAPSDLLPVGSGTFEAIKTRVAAPAEGGTDDQEAAAPTDGGEDAHSGGADADAERERQSGGASESTPTGGPTEESLFDRLLALLPWLLALAGVAGLAVYYRERIRRLLAGGEADDPPNPDPPPDPPSPEDAVARRWNAMLSTLGVERRPTKTPMEYAREAEDGGGDRDSVRALTDLFRAVRYGDAPVTEERVDAAEDALERVRREEP